MAGLESLVGSVKRLLGTTIGYFGTTALLGLGLLSGGAGLSGCFEEEDQVTDSNEVSELSAVAGDRRVNLSWEHAKRMEVPGVMIRRKVDSFPTDFSDGELVYEGTADSYTDMRLGYDIRYCYRVFSFTYTEPQVFSNGRISSAIPYDCTPPGEVLDFGTVPKATSFDITWKNPEDFDFVGVIVRKKAGSFPTDKDDGVLIYEGSGESCTDNGLTEGEYYYYTVFTYDEVPHFSPGLNLLRKLDHVSPVGWIGGGSNGWKTGLGSFNDNEFNRFYFPRGIFVDFNENIYVADTEQNRICKWDNNGNALGWIGGGSNGWKTNDGASANWGDYQSFDSPMSLVLDSEGNIYIADFLNYRVCKWDANGNAVGWIGGGQNGWRTDSAAWANPFFSDNSWVNPGLKYPSRVSVNGAGDIFVSDWNGVSRWNSAGHYCDSGHSSDIFKTRDLGGNIYYTESTNNRVLKKDSLDNIIGWIGGGSDGWKTGPGATSASDHQSFSNPQRTFYFNGYIYVVDSNNHRISKWHENGTAVGWIGEGSSGWKTTSGAISTAHFNSFRAPTGIFLHNGNIYVSDRWNNRISKWDLNGNAIGWIGGSSNGWKTGLAPPYSSDYQSFDNPRGVSVDNNGNIHVADSYNHRISIWYANGDARGWIGDGDDGWNTHAGTTYIHHFDEDNPRKFYYPYHVTVGGDLNINVLDYRGLQVWSNSGNYLGTSVPAPSIVFTDPNGNTYSIGTGHRVFKWDNNGNLIGWIGGGSDGWKTGPGTSAGSGDKSFWYPRRVFVDGNGTIYVTDSGNNRVSKWQD
ncbi:MAG: NHL repeat-containing protein [Nanoarchaeota archaeon]|nr:NHL repeat-containing protein [Nanoarchaeota archaeon]